MLPPSSATPLLQSHLVLLLGGANHGRVLPKMAVGTPPLQTDALPLSVLTPMTVVPEVPASDANTERPRLGGVPSTCQDNPPNLPNTLVGSSVWRSLTPCPPGIRAMCMCLECVGLTSTELPRMLRKTFPQSVRVSFCEPLHYLKPDDSQAGNWHVHRRNAKAKPKLIEHPPPEGSVKTTPHARSTRSGGNCGQNLDDPMECQECGLLARPWGMPDPFHTLASGSDTVHAPRTPFQGWKTSRTDGVRSLLPRLCRIVGPSCVQQVYGEHLQQRFL